jgi:hypothetical protein
MRNDTFDTASPDPLESDLRAFSPVEPSRGLADRITGELSDYGRTAPMRFRYFAAVGAAAACVTLAAVTWRVMNRPVNPTPVVITVPPPAPADRDGTDRPALAIYRRALSRSPAALDDLLDRHAARLLPGGQATATGPVTASSRIDLLR